MARNNKTNNSNKNFHQIVKSIAVSAVNKHTNAMRKKADAEQKKKEVAEIVNGGNGV